MTAATTTRLREGPPPPELIRKIAVDAHAPPPADAQHHRSVRPVRGRTRRGARARGRPSWRSNGRRRGWTAYCSTTVEIYAFVEKRTFRPPSNLTASRRN